MSDDGTPYLRWLLRLALVSASIFLAFHYWPSDISRVETNTRRMLKAVSKSGNESLPVAAAKSFDAVSYLASNVVLSLGEPFPSSLRKAEVAPLLQQARMRATKLEVKSLGHQIEKKPDGTIWMDITLDADLEVRGVRDQLLGNYRLVWRMEGDDWKVAQAEVIEVIQHPSGSSYPF